MTHSAKTGRDSTKVHVEMEPTRKATVLVFPSQRPLPPDEVLGVGPNFLPSSDLERWIRGTFLSPGTGLYNPEHDHLQDAVIGVLWAGVENVRQMRRVIATAEDPSPVGMGAWKKARAEQQIREWFDVMPNFLITIDASFGQVANNREFCAVIEHELYHCAQALDEFGGPRFHRETGRPIYAMKGHDVEEFIGVAQRYGLPADLEALLRQAEQQPKVPARMIDGVCGTCARKAA